MIDGAKGEEEPSGVTLPQVNNENGDRLAQATACGMIPAFPEDTMVSSHSSSQESKSKRR